MIALMMCREQTSNFGGRDSLIRRQDDLGGSTQRISRTVCSPMHNRMELWQLSGQNENVHTPPLGGAAARRSEVFRGSRQLVSQSFMLVICVVLLQNTNRGKGCANVLGSTSPVTRVWGIAREHSDRTSPEPWGRNDLESSRALELSKYPCEVITESLDWRGSSELRRMSL